MRPEILLWLGALIALLVFLALEPLGQFALFGSDTGEYYRLTATLVTTGHIPRGIHYLGWGTAYPDFPGIFLLTGAGAGALGLSTFTALTVLLPVVVTLSVLPLFLLFRRIYPHDTVALLGAAFASVAMPRMFSLAHPAPLALGDFLCVAALWMFVEGRRDLRWYLPLGLTSAALIVTHHLSTYFFVISALLGLLLLELWRPRLWSRRFPTREFAFLGALVTGTFVYWFFAAKSFVNLVIVPGLGNLPGTSFAALESLALLTLLAAAALLRYRRGRRPLHRWVRLPSDRSLVRDLVIIAVVVFGAVSLLLLVPLPGTTQMTNPATILWFTPLLGFGLLAAGSRRTPTLARLGPFTLTWLGALGISALATLVAGGLAPQISGFINAIPPSRHVEYLLIPVGLLVAIGAGRLVARAGDRAGRRAMVAASVGLVVLIAANAAIVYPPQADFGGFQEGLTHGDATLWMWVGLGAPPTWVVATDHRLSSMIFGFDGNPATWDSTPALFNGANWTAALSELRASDAPHTLRPIDLVAVDSVMYTGVALNPSAIAQPLSTAAQHWFTQLPFVPLYRNGLEVVYLVVLSSAPSA